MDSILEEYQAPELIRRYFPGGMVECSQEGHPLWIVPLGGVDIKGFLKLVPAAALLRHTAYLMEFVERVKERASLTMERPVETQYIVFDFENFSLLQLYSWEVMTAFADFLRIYEDHYPEILEKAFVINAPSFFPMIWRMLRPFMTQRTVKKVHIFGKNGWRQVLRDHFQPEVLPKHWGGDMLGQDGDPRCKDKVNPGGEVPAFPEMGPNPCSRIIPYRDAWELRVAVEKADSLLRWSFDAQSGELAFALRYLPFADDEAQGLPGEQLTQPVRLAGLQQGSLRCDKPGTYILVFDNSFSWLNSKNLTYSVEVQPPEQSE